MSPETAYLLFGATLCAALVGISIYFYSRRRKGRIESAKYTMLEDDDR
jgi:cbb3-type cytochrome oxidase subunit 3